MKSNVFCFSDCLVDDNKLIVFPNSMNLRRIRLFCVYSSPIEHIHRELSIVFISVFETLNTLTFETSIAPESFIFYLIVFLLENSVSALKSFCETSFICAPIRTDEDAKPVSFGVPKLAFIIVS